MKRKKRNALSPSSLCIRRFCEAGGGGGGSMGRLKCFLPSGLSLEGSYVSHNSLLVTITASLSDHNKLNKGEQSSDLKK